MNAPLTPKQRDYVDTVAHNLRGMSGVSSGLCPGCEQCREDHGIPTMEEFREQWSRGLVSSEPHFSHEPCGVCGSPLGGSREVWHWIDDSGTIHHETDMCSDCVCYLANGDVPELD